MEGGEGRKVWRLNESEKEVSIPSSEILPTLTT